MQRVTGTALCGALLLGTSAFRRTTGVGMTQHASFIVSGALLHSAFQF